LAVSTKQQKETRAECKEDFKRLKKTLPNSTSMDFYAFVS
jgi:hypothetical protein